VSNPTWPIYTFEINLETLRRYDWSLPYATQLVGNETVIEADFVKFTRSSWLASLFPGFEFIANKHGVQFTAYGQKAQYLKNTYVTGSPEDVLKLVV
jgi:hypothetical protein